MNSHPFLLTKPLLVHALLGYIVNCFLIWCPQQDAIICLCLDLYGHGDMWLLLWNLNMLWTWTIIARIERRLMLQSNVLPEPLVHLKHHSHSTLCHFVMMSPYFILCSHYSYKSCWRTLSVDRCSSPPSGVSYRNINASEANQIVFSVHIINYIRQLTKHIKRDKSV